MALDKNFLKYKLEKIKNDDIFKDQDTESKRRQRKENAKKARKEADAIHSYITGVDEKQALSNRSFIEPDSMPGNLFISDIGQLSLTQVDGPKTKSSKILALLNRHKNFSNANSVRKIKLKALQKIFDGLKLVFQRNKISLEKNLEVKGNVELGEKITIGKDGIVGNNFKVGRVLDTRNLVVRNEIIIKKDLKIGGNTNIFKSLKVNDNISVKKSGHVRGNLKIDGDIELGGELNFVDVAGRQGVAPQSLTPNGYVELPGGVIMQWGTDTRNQDEAYIVNFPKPFPNAVFSVMLNRQASNDAGQNKTWAVTATLPTTTGFTIDRDDDISGTQTMNWLAIGN
jgi:hypothetical protein